jgi:drug/metabolite transporter (DMT)-like permease
VLVAFLWALCFPLINIGLSSAPPLKFAGLRAMIAGVTVLMFAVAMRQALPRGWRVWFKLSVVAAGATTLGFFGMFIGGARVAPGLATVIENTQPLIAITLAWIILGESLSVRRRVGLFLGFGGILVISLPHFLDAAASTGSGIAILLLSALGVALANVVLKSLAGKIDVLMAVGWQLLLGSVPLLVAGLFFEQHYSVHWDRMFLFVLLTLSLLGTASASALWFFLLRRATLGRLNTFTFLTPVFGLLLSFVLFGEQFNLWEIAGTVLVLCGVWQMTRGATEEHGQAMRSSQVGRSSNT